MSAVRFIAAAGLLAAAPLYAQDKIVRVDSIFSFASTLTPGCAAGVTQQGKLILDKYYGLADVDRKIPLGPNSLFDIGSTQKQFTATSMLLLAQDNEGDGGGMSDRQLRDEDGARVLEPLDHRCVLVEAAVAERRRPPRGRDAAARREEILGAVRNAV